MAACRLGGLLRDQRDVGDSTARAHFGRIRGEIVAREGDRLESFARGGHELQVVAVVPRDAVAVDFEADARVRVYPGLEVGDADDDVIDAGEDGYSAWMF